MGLKNIEYTKNLVKCVRGESIWYSPLTLNQFLFFGVGKVRKISKGDEFDLVQIQPRPLFKKEQMYLRNMIVMENRARRQLLTLKCGQFAMFYGRAICIYEDFTKPDGTKVRFQRWQFFPFACQGWYVPSMFDVKKAESELKDEEIDELQQAQIDTINHILDKVEKIKLEDLEVDEND